MSAAWDRILLLVSLLALMAVAVVLSLGTADFHQSLTSGSAGPARTSGPEVLKPDAMKQRIDQLLQPPNWAQGDGDHQLFVGRRFIYFPDKNVIKLYEDDLQFDGLPLSWITKYKLSITDVLVGHRDPDGDGFTNLSEFKGSTDPTDAASHPPYISIMRVKDRSEKTYRIKFQNVSEIEGQSVFQLATPDSSKHSRQVRLGEVFDGFKVVGFQAKSQTPQPPEFITDVSELRLLNEKSQENATLVINREANVPEVSVSFVLLAPGLVDAPVTARVGEEFSITVPVPNRPATVNRYKLTRSTPEATTVSDLVQNASVTVPAFDEKEAADLVAQ